MTTNKRLERLTQVLSKRTGKELAVIGSLENWVRSIEALARALGYEGERDDFISMLKRTLAEVTP